MGKLEFHDISRLRRDTQPPSRTSFSGLSKTLQLPLPLWEGSCSLPGRKITRKFPSPGVVITMRVEHYLTTLFLVIKSGINKMCLFHINWAPFSLKIYLFVISFVFSFIQRDVKKTIINFYLTFFFS